MAVAEERKTWPLQDAKARFSELVILCGAQGSQTITKHGKPAAVLVPWETYQAMTTRRESLGAFLASAPRVELDTSRSRETERGLEI